MIPLAQSANVAQESEPARGSEPGHSPAISFEDIYESHVDFVWRAACRLGVDASDADDVVQEVFLTAHRRLLEFQGRASVKTWLFGILHNMVQHYRRSHARKRRHLAAEGPFQHPGRLPDVHAAGPAESVEHTEAMRVLDHLLRELDDRKRAVFVLAEIEQMTANEIADALGMNANTVYSRLRVARQEFEQALARYRAGVARRNP
jgi:RNA polymerase sigma-70 factor (ECF subfamily)